MNEQERLLRTILGEYGIREAGVIRALGGTTATSVYVNVAGKEYVLRRRPAEFSKDAYIDYDHSLIRYLSKHGFPVCPIVSTPGNKSWIVHAGETFELAQYVSGAPVMEPDEEQLRQCGRLLADLHRLGKGFAHGGKSDFAREDHFSILGPVLRDLRRSVAGRNRQTEVERLTDLASSISKRIDEELAPRLEKSVIHGDYHPGNILFHNGKISALLDFYYSAAGPTLRDIGDGLMFVASRRASPLDVDDIRSLTQTWKPDVNRMAAFLGGYASVRKLPDGIEHLATLMISRWIQCRVRGSRKIPKEERVAFVFNGLWETIDMLENVFPGSFMAAVRTKSSGEFSRIGRPEIERRRRSPLRCSRVEDIIPTEGAEDAFRRRHRLPR